MTLTRLSVVITIGLPSMLTVFGMGVCRTVAYCIPRTYFSKKHRQLVVDIHAICEGLGTVLVTLLLVWYLYIPSDWRVALFVHLLLTVMALASTNAVLIIAYYESTKPARFTQTSRKETENPTENKQQGAGKDDQKIQIVIEENYKKPNLIRNNQNKPHNASKSSQITSMKKDTETRKSRPDDLDLFDDTNSINQFWCKGQTGLFILYVLGAGGAAGVFYTFTPFVFISHGWSAGQMYLMVPLFSCIALCLHLLVISIPKMFRHPLLATYIVVMVCSVAAVVIMVLQHTLL